MKTGSFLIFLHFAFCLGLSLDINVPSTQTHPNPLTANPSQLNTTLHLSAVVNMPTFPYHARVECWALTTPFIRYPTIGRALDLGDMANATYVVLPPRSEEGWHRPPHPMYVCVCVYVLLGLSHVSAPTCFLLSLAFSLPDFLVAMALPLPRLHLDRTKPYSRHCVTPDHAVPCVYYL